MLRTGNQMLTNVCPICGKPTTAAYCELHRKLGTASNVVRKDIEKADAVTNLSHYTRRAVDAYNSLSDEGKLGVSLLCAVMKQNAERRVKRRGQTKVGVGSLSALEIIVGLVMAEQL